ncbi:MAG: hypothetical protein HY243_14465, partial [Proteobacteria bacterium]|nr:hypothetical protein [Pseudomonadota bacterium]
KTFFHTDRLGSVVEMTSTTGARTEGPYTYDPYGQPSATTGEPFKFTGRRLDAETGLYYYRARYYSVGVGFLSTDPVGYSAGMNLYEYVGDDPVDNTDPSGRTIVVMGDDNFKKQRQADYDDMQKSPEGKQSYDQLQNSKNIHVVVPSQDKFPHTGTASHTVNADGSITFKVDTNGPNQNSQNGTGSDSVIYMPVTQDRQTNLGPRDDSGSRVEPTSVVLAHETGHAVDIDNGKLVAGKSGLSPQKTGTTPPAERTPVNLENAVRRALGMPERSSYYYPGWQQDQKSDGR